MEQVFKRWEHHAEQVYLKGLDLNYALNELQRVFMDDLTSFDFSTEIVNDLYTFSDLLREVVAM